MPDRLAVGRDHVEGFDLVAQLGALACGDDPVGRKRGDERGPLSFRGAQDAREHHLLLDVFQRSAGLVARPAITGLAAFVLEPVARG